MINDLDGLISSIDSDNPRPKKDKPDENILSKLLTACETFDMGEVDAVMKEIDYFQYESDDGIVDWLRENVELVNFDEIVQKLSGLFQGKEDMQ